MATTSAKLLYAKDLPLYHREKPYQVLPPLSMNLGDIPPSNLKFETVEETIQDIRLVDRPFSLDDNGFCYAIAPTSFSDWDSQSKVEEYYLPEVETLLMRLVDGADEVKIFDWRVSQIDQFHIFFSFHSSSLSPITLSPFPLQTITINS